MPDDLLKIPIYILKICGKANIMSQSWTTHVQLVKRNLTECGGVEVEKDKILWQIPRGWMLKRFQKEAANRYLGLTCVSLWLHITIKLNTRPTNTDRTVNTTKQGYKVGQTCPNMFNKGENAVKRYK